MRPSHRRVRLTLPPVPRRRRGRRVETVAWLNRPTPWRADRHASPEVRLRAGVHRLDADRTKDASTTTATGTTNTAAETRTTVQVIVAPVRRAARRYAGAQRHPCHTRRHGRSHGQQRSDLGRYLPHRRRLLHVSGPPRREGVRAQYPGGRSTVARALPIASHCHLARRTHPAGRRASISCVGRLDSSPPRYEATPAPSSEDSSRAASRRGARTLATPSRHDDGRSGAKTP